MAKGTSQKKSDGSALDFEAQLWAAAEQAVLAPDYEKPQNNSARPEGLCLGLIFLKYTSDAFEEKAHEKEIAALAEDEPENEEEET